MFVLDVETKFRNVLILESRNWFSGCGDIYDPAKDLVLTYDFALKREVEAAGGTAAYLDCLVDPAIMQENNFRAYEYFRKWHLDELGNDLFVHAGVPFGFSFRIEFWNDFIFYVRARLCLEILRQLRFEALFSGTSLGLAESILSEMGIAFIPVERRRDAAQPEYFFPIHQWMSEKIRKTGVGDRIRTLATWSWGSLMSWFDRFLRVSTTKPLVMVQQYHPTQALARRLKREGKVNVLGGALSKNLILAPTQLARSRFIPLWGSGDYRRDAEESMRRYRAKRHARLTLSTGTDITESVNALIERKVANRIPETIRILALVVRYLRRHPVRLEVMITNLGELHTHIDSVCKAEGVPSYLIVNGWMSGDFLDESKYATVINAYSQSIRDNYFRGMDNVVCLGDPRMDSYASPPPPRDSGKTTRTITIGAAGHSNIDLNSYVAWEFDFMRDVLQALAICKNAGMNLNILIKVRENGYLRRYQEFCAEYFPGIVNEIVDSAPMKDILGRTDFYISIYSQTLFEASCLGIPCLYYKNDREYLDPPFDGNSEVVTARSVDQLVAALRDFSAGSDRFDAFLRRDVMEKYIGPLDGGNLERNIEFIYDLLNKRASGRTTALVS